MTLYDIPRSARVTRKPQHRWYLRNRPWQLQPFVIAPVLPGETLRSAVMQARVVSDPIKDPLTGWWTEYYLWYVTFQQMPQRAKWEQMLLEPASWDPEANDDGLAFPWKYKYANSIDWVHECIKPVIENYFRVSPEVWDVAKIGDHPVTSINNDSWSDSLVLESIYEQSGQEAVPPTIADTQQEIDEWRYERFMEMSDMTYEDYVQSYGVKGPAVARDPGIPELIRYSRSWTYPTNTVNPADGKPSTAVSWSVSERADKDRFFRQPGFIFGLCVTRPKVYFGNQGGAAIALLDNGLSWLPAVMATTPMTSVRTVTAIEGLVGPSLPTVPYVVDVRDLFLYGDQFIYDPATTPTWPRVAAPRAADVTWRYPTAVDADGLFVGAAANTVRQDGVISLNISGRQVDVT